VHAGDGFAGFVDSTDMKTAVLLWLEPEFELAEIQSRRGEIQRGG